MILKQRLVTLLSLKKQFEIASTAYSDYKKIIELYIQQNELVGPFVVDDHVYNLLDGKILFDKIEELPNE